jgi:hypothetical protein
MISTEVGFYAQLKGRLAKKRYKVATVFVNHFSRLHFIHLQLDTSLEKTMASKIAFEHFATEHGVKLLHFHCDNRRFFENTFSKACHDSRQKVTFCGVNAYFKKRHH